MALARKRTDHMKEFIERKQRPVLKARPQPPEVTVEEAHKRAMAKFALTREILA